MANAETKIPVLPFLSSQCLTLGSRLGTKLINTKAVNPLNVFDGYLFKGVANVQILKQSV
ncbi:hypothetical protein [Wolbachia endosymbiont of Dactylopius coccus]|nr:MAG: hypothetical protein TV42_04895 [Wolbachia endosymbiont of Dactylopius coccus]OAM03164.1 MAG: hypothetical protein TV42_05530 [Wolbachia endosymbiont of Dactylopius coccus]